MSDELFESVIELLSKTKDLGWQLRPGGEYSRLLKFPRPVSKDERTIVVPALCIAGPQDRVIPPDGYQAKWSSDHLFLRIVTRATKPPASVTLPTGFSTTLFGTRADQCEVLS